MSPPLADAVAGADHGNFLGIAVAQVFRKARLGGGVGLWFLGSVSGAGTTPIAVPSSGAALWRAIWSGGGAEAGSIFMFTAAIIKTSMGFGRGRGTG